MPIYVHYFSVDFVVNELIKRKVDGNNELLERHEKGTN